MRNVKPLLFLSCLAIVLSGCNTTGPTIPETELVADLPPMEGPMYTVGQRVDYLDEVSGESRYFTVTDVSKAGTISANMSTGCKWTQSANWFTGSLAWEGCGSGDWSTGTHEPVTEVESLWPLQVGATAKYQYKLTNSAGDESIYNRSCDVSAVNIETSVGPLDSYKVLCKDRRGEFLTVRTWYFNPEHGELRFSRWTSDGGMKTNNKYL